MSPSLDDPSDALVRIVPHTRPLYFHEGRLYCARYDRICSTDDYGRTFSVECRLQLELPLRSVLRASSLAQRVARALVYRMRVLPNGNRLFIFRRGIYVQRPGERVARRTLPITRGSRPLSLAVSADGRVVFGEYWANPSLEPVRVFASQDGGETWEVVFTFGPGEILHVHGISYDQWERCFWICTGDQGDQCQLLRASVDFRDVRIVRQGGQGNRFYSILVTERELITATDTPLEPNSICAIDKRTGEVRTVALIENSSFHSCFVGGRYFVATNAEPSKVNDVHACHIWMSNPKGGDCRRILTLPIDFFSNLSALPLVPPALFQFPQVFFPEGDNPGQMLVCHCIGLLGLDDAMVCYDVSGWPSSR